jgi:hypothetical protein
MRRTLVLPREEDMERAVSLATTHKGRVFAQPRRDNEFRVRDEPSERVEKVWCGFGHASCSPSGENCFKKRAFHLVSRTQLVADRTRCVHFGGTERMEGADVRSSDVQAQGAKGGP